MGSMTDVLDPEAALLFKQLQGIDTAYGKNRMAETFQEEERRRDAQMVRIVALLDLIGSYLLAGASGRHSDAEAGILEKILAHIGRLRALTASPQILLRYHGMPADQDGRAVADYDISLAPLRFSGADVTAAARRLDAKAARVAETAQRAFALLARCGIQTLYIKLPGQGTLQERQMRIALQVMAGFKAAAAGGTPIRVICGQKCTQLPVIHGDQGLPDENLTLLTAVNGITGGAMAAVVKKITAANLHDRYLNAYNAIFAVKNLKSKLVKPPMEINNLLWLVSSQEDGASTPEKTGIARLAVRMAGSTPMAVAGTLQAVYGDDYARVNADHLGHRLQLSSGLLAAADQTPASAAMEKEILTNIESRLDQVQDQVFDDLFSMQKLAAFGGDKNRGFLSGLHERVRSMVTFYKRRVDTNKKMRQIVTGDVTLTEEEYQTLARDYHISQDDARRLIPLLRSCFDKNGRFLKAAFAQIIPEFKPYEEKILAFLWNYLLGCIHEKDRIAFLNALQSLITQMQQPKRALGMLLADFCQDTKRVKHSDAKALMLCSLLIRSSDKELVNVEVTPEEILQVETGINRAVAGYAAWKVDQDQKRIFEKIQTVHQQFIASSGQGGMEPREASAQFLLELEREAYIFLALVGGVTARSVILSAVKEYGDPDAMIYDVKKRRTVLAALTKNLRVTIRALGRVGQREDLSVLEEIQRKSLDLMALERTPGHQEQIKRILEWAAHSARTIGEAA